MKSSRYIGGRMKCVSLFSGAGGLDLGLRSTGIEIVASVEADPDCCATLKANGFAHVRQSAIESLPARALRNELGLAAGELDLLVGGPPCQPFSKSAFWATAAAQGLLDPRSKTLEHFCAYVDEFKPRAVILENVEGFEQGGGLDYVKSRLAAVRRRGRQYKFATKLVDASSYGVPQRRRRLFLVATAEGAPFKFPPPTHGVGCLPLVTAWEACRLATANYEEDLTLRGRWADLIPSIPEGKNYLWHTSRGGGVPLFGWRTRYWSFLLKLDKRAPAPTLVASPSQNSGPFHWSNRLLSTAELAALQTFPQRYRFKGDRPSRQRQLGNAVPPLLSQRLGLAILDHFGLPSREVANLEIPRLKRFPRSEEPAAVEKKYLALIGEHAAHPGTGKGPRPRLEPTMNSADDSDDGSTRRVA